jgi:hypothetical protein
LWITGSSWRYNVERYRKKILDMDELDGSSTVQKASTGKTW